jgi:hypothetical protein
MEAPMHEAIPNVILHYTNNTCIYYPNYALNKTHSEASIKLLHVSAPGCHHQGFIQNKEVQAEHANLGIVSPLLE